MKNLMRYIVYTRRGSSVSIVTRLGLDDRDSVPGMGSKVFFLVTTASRPALGPTLLLSNAYRGLFLSG
jgi:hypothetical protein